MILCKKYSVLISLSTLAKGREEKMRPKRDGEHF